MSERGGGVLVTGGTGFVGSAVVRHLRRQGRRVVATTTGTLDRPGLDSDVEWIRWDATSERLPDADFRSLQAVVHLAVPRALFDFPASADPIYRVVVDATFQLLEASRAASVGRFILASTGDVLGSRPDGGLENDRSYRPSSFYGAAKGAAELLALGYREQIPVAILRLYHPYGSGGERFLINRLAARVISGQQVTIEGTRGVTLTPVWIDDCAAGICLAIDSSADGVFHLAGPDRLSLRKLLELTGELSGSPADIRSLDAEPVECHAGDDSRSRALLGYLPRVSIRDGLQRVIDQIRTEAGMSQG